VEVGREGLRCAGERRALDASAAAWLASLWRAALCVAMAAPAALAARLRALG
jgi:hypothetical protein